MVGLNPTLATTVLLPLQFLFSYFSLKSEEEEEEKKKKTACFWMDAFEFVHVIICIVKAGLKVLILVLRQFLPHEIFWLLHL